VIKARMAKASGELSHWDEYEYVLTNAVLDKSFEQLKTILTAERAKRGDFSDKTFGGREVLIDAAEQLKRERQPGLSGFVRGLQAKL